MSAIPSRAGDNLLQPPLSRLCSIAGGSHRSQPPHFLSHACCFTLAFNSRRHSRETTGHSGWGSRKGTVDFHFLLSFSKSNSSVLSLGSATTTCCAASVSLPAFVFSSWPTQIWPSKLPFPHPPSPTPTHCFIPASNSIRLLWEPAGHSRQ